MSRVARLRRVMWHCSRPPVDRGRLRRQRQEAEEDDKGKEETKKEERRIEEGG